MDKLNIINQKVYCRYVNFINTRKLRFISAAEFTENHHIVPKSCGGSDHYSNIIELTAREHFIAHWMLSKALGGSQACAFWIMCNDLRNKHYRYVNSIAYEHARKQHSKFISEFNTGWVTCYDRILDKGTRILREEFSNNDRYESHSKGKASYYIDGKIVQLYTNDPRIATGEAVSIRVGYKHTKETKEKMSANGIKNRIMITHSKTFERRYIEKDDIIPEGFIIGMSEDERIQLKENCIKTFSVIKWITNGVDNKRIPIYSESDIPDGWKIGRTLEKLTCPYCNKTVDKPNYGQHHGKKCKHYKGE